MGNKTPTEDDVIIDQYGAIVAAPIELNGVPLFNSVGFACYETNEAMWWRLCKQLSEHVTQEEQRKLDDHWAFMKRVKAKDKQAIIQFNFRLRTKAHFPTSHTAEPVKVMPPRIYGYENLHVCQHCKQKMFRAYGWYKFCSERCRREQHKQQARTWARDNRPSRAKSHNSPTCQHCGETFIPKRSDARFCSTKCRVYHNRQSRQ